MSNRSICNEYLSLIRGVTPLFPARTYARGVSSGHIIDIQTERKSRGDHHDKAVGRASFLDIDSTYLERARGLVQVLARQLRLGRSQQRRCIALLGSHIRRRIGNRKSRRLASSIGRRQKQFSVRFVSRRWWARGGAPPPLRPAAAAIGTAHLVPARRPPRSHQPPTKKGVIYR